MLKQGQTLETEVEEEQLQRKLILTVAATVSLLVLVGLVIIVSISVMRRYISDGHISAIFPNFERLAYKTEPVYSTVTD